MNGPRGAVRVWGAVVLTVVLAMATVPWNSGRPAGARSGEVPRLLVLSLPTLGWADLYQGASPAIDALLDGAAVAAMSVRDVDATTNANDGYAALSAGSRAQGVLRSGEVLDASETYVTTPAATIFARTTGVAVDTGLVALGFPHLVSTNADLEYDAQLGALGQSLADAMVPRAAIANADGDLTNRGGVVPSEVAYQRQAAMSLVDETGWVPAGAVTDALLRRDPSAPFGLRYQQEAVVAAFSASWRQGGVVLVEGSDLARADRYGPLATPVQRQALRQQALRDTDDLVARMLLSVDFARDTVLVVAPYHSAGGVELTVAGLRSPGQAPGLLRSATTRRAGLVTLVDIAPTILSVFGVPRPGSMEGRQFERVNDGSVTGATRAESLAQINDAARYRDRMVAPVAIVFTVLQALLWVAVAVALRSDSERTKGRVALAALTMLAYLPATYLAGLIRFADAPALAYWAFVIGLSVMIASGASALGRRAAIDPLLFCLGLVFGLLAVDMVLGAPLQLNTVFGYSPTVGGRFAGMGNLAFGQFAAATFLLCGLLSRRLAGRSFGTALAFGVLIVAILIDGMPIWGSDVGGVMALIPAAGVTGAYLVGRPVHGRSVVGLAMAAGVALVGFGVLDLSRPADQRTHLGRLWEAIIDRGPGAFQTVVIRKLGANLSVVTGSAWMALIPLLIAAVVYLLWHAPARVQPIRDTLSGCVPGLALVALLGFMLNDSGIAVPGLMLGVVNASVVYVTVVTLAREPVA